MLLSKMLRKISLKNTWGEGKGGEGRGGEGREEERIYYPNDSKYPIHVYTGMLVQYTMYMYVCIIYMNICTCIKPAHEQASNNSSTQ